jgi:hypothetical protein
MKKLIIIIIILFWGGFGFSQSDSLRKMEEVFINPEFYPSYPGGEAKLLQLIEPI